MAKRRIDTLTPGEIVTLKFHAGYGNAEDIEKHRFIGIVGEGDKRRAKFESTVPFQQSQKQYFWEAYRYVGRWAYGTSAQWLSLMED